MSTYWYNVRGYTTPRTAEVFLWLCLGHPHVVFRLLCLGAVGAAVDMYWLPRLSGFPLKEVANDFSTPQGGRRYSSNPFFTRLYIL